MKQLEVQIMGQSYLLGCPEGGESRLREAVERVDSAMCKIRDAGKVRARDRIAVLAALNLAFDLSDKGNPMATEVSSGNLAPMAAERGAAATSTDDAVLSALLFRLDDVLSEDGQLL
jgi:cell division protein ZapA